MEMNSVKNLLGCIPLRSEIPVMKSKGLGHSRRLVWRSRLAATNTSAAFAVWFRGSCGSWTSDDSSEEFDRCNVSTTAFMNA